MIIIIITEKVRPVKRINGSTPSQRAVAVAKATGKRSNTVIIATQNDYRDALAIAPYAYVTKSPILYAETNKKLSAETTAYLKSAGYTVFGGVNAPYIWLQCGKDSWDFFDELLNEKQIVGTPGVGFGAAGAGYFRMTAFATRENTLAAMDRICK